MKRLLLALFIIPSVCIGADIDFGAVQVQKERRFKFHGIEYNVSSDTNKYLIFKYEISGDVKTIEITGSEYNTVADSFVTWSQYVNYCLDREGLPNVTEDQSKVLFLNP